MAHAGDPIATSEPVKRGFPSDAPSRPVALNARRRIAIRVGGWLLSCLGRTWRVRVVGREALLTRSAGDARVVLTLWHGQMLPILWVHRQPTGVLISEHRDGEIIARIVSRFGFFGVRGSTSRGGARALLECVQVLRQGADIAITPDGPRGPRHSFAAGALVVAFRAGASVVPIVAHVDRAWRLRSWDAFEIPKPFARVTVRYGVPRTVRADSVREVTALAPAYAAAMQQEMAQVALLARDDGAV
jgi:lysophospholipid acyltransferase (LPLAT)-like uncharacterized protein